jgi:radical SAM protein with 4Fe4S-binding SPASM domain
LSPAETRAVVDQIFDRTEDLIGRGFNKDILTVDNHTDGVYLYRRLLTTDPARAEDALQLLRWNAGNSTGLGIANVDCLGNVHPDQFWQGHTLGNIRERKFSEIWTDPSIDLLRNLRNRHELLHGRCRECRYLDICNGNFRARAEAVHDDLWAPDPACYLTDEEIGVA